jgi:ABC-type branched-subunit amino acid transport system substrate-binding protein
MPFRPTEKPGACQHMRLLRDLRQNHDKNREKTMPARPGYIGAIAAFASVALIATLAYAQKKYDPGATDTEIKIGNIMPYSGPASSYGVIGKTEAAFFKMINEQGGINGRKINFISYDDAYSPPKAIEQARKLVESDEVLLIFQALGTPSNSAIMKYMNAKKVPQLFVASGGTKFRRTFPGRWAFSPTTRARGASTRNIFATSFPTARSRCSGRMTTPARISSRA